MTRVIMGVFGQLLVRVHVVVPASVGMLVVVCMQMVVLMAVIVPVSVGMDLVAMPMLMLVFVMVLVTVLVRVVVGALHVVISGRRHLLMARSACLGKTAAAYCQRRLGRPTAIFGAAPFRTQSSR